MDIQEIIKKVMGDKDLMEKIKKADLSEAAELLKNANIDIKDVDVEKIKAAVSKGDFDLGSLKDLAGGILGGK